MLRYESPLSITHGFQQDGRQSIISGWPLADSILFTFDSIIACIMQEEHNYIDEM